MNEYSDLFNDKAAKQATSSLQRGSTAPRDFHVAENLDNDSSDLNAVFPDDLMDQSEHSNEGVSKSSKRDQILADDLMRTGLLSSSDDTHAYSDSQDDVLQQDLQRYNSDGSQTLDDVIDDSDEAEIGLSRYFKTGLSQHQLDQRRYKVVEELVHPGMPLSDDTNALLRKVKYNRIPLSDDAYDLMQHEENGMPLSYATHSLMDSEQDGGLSLPDTANHPMPLEYADRMPLLDSDLMHPENANRLLLSDAMNPYEHLASPSFAASTMQSPDARGNENADALSSENDANIMLMTPATAFSNHDALRALNRDDSADDVSGLDVDQFGVSGDYGDLGDEINIEIVKQIEASKKQHAEIDPTRDPSLHPANLSPILTDAVVPGNRIKTRPGNLHHVSYQASDASGNGSGSSQGTFSLILFFLCFNQIFHWLLNMNNCVKMPVSRVLSGV